MTAALQKTPKEKPNATSKIRGALGFESYREGFYFLIGIVNLLAGTIFCLTFFALYIADTHRPQDVFYAANFENKIRPLHSFTEPIISQEALLKWAATAATEIMTFGFSDYDEKLFASQKYFTPGGWLKFAPAIMASVALKSAISSQQIIVAIPQKTPTILSEGVIKGKYTWKVELRLLLSIRAGANKSTDYVTVTLDIIKMPTTEMASGLGIDLWESH